MFIANPIEKLSAEGIIKNQIHKKLVELSYIPLVHALICLVWCIEPRDIFSHLTQIIPHIFG